MSEVIDIVGKSHDRDRPYRAFLDRKDSGKWSLRVDIVGLEGKEETGHTFYYWCGEVDSREEAIAYVEEFEQTGEIPDEFFFSQERERRDSSYYHFTQVEAHLVDGVPQWSVSLMEDEFYGPWAIVSRIVPFEEIGVWFLRSERELDEGDYKRGEP